MFSNFVGYIYFLYISIKVKENIPYIQVHRDLIAVKNEISILDPRATYIPPPLLDAGRSICPQSCGQPPYFFLHSPALVIND